MPNVEPGDLARRRAEIARLSRQARRGQAAPERIASARADYAEAKLAAYIRSVVDAAPPLSREQLTRLTLLLRGGDAA